LGAGSSAARTASGSTRNTPAKAKILIISTPDLSGANGPRGRRPLEIAQSNRRFRAPGLRSVFHETWAA
jgi:hypothetical protein